MCKTDTYLNISNKMLSYFSQLFKINLNNENSLVLHCIEN